MYEPHDIALVDGYFDEEEEFEPYDPEWFESPYDVAGGWTDFPMLRGAISEQLAELDDDALSDALWDEGFDAEELEGFMQVLGDIGRAIGNALPAIGTGAATGASLGSVVPGLGTGIGAAVGGVLGGLGSILGQLGSQRGTQRPRPSRPAPSTVRPGVTRGDPTPPAPARPAAPSSASSTQTLMRLLTNPQVIQAITALALGTNGRRTIQVAGRPVPREAFAELVAELAGESITGESESMAPEQYLAGEDGEALVDLASPAERAGGLIGLLAAEALDIEVPGTDLVLAAPWAGESGEYEEDFVEEVPDVEHLPDSWETWDESAGAPEAAPAIIAVAGVLISGASLGLGVFDRLQRHLLSGAFEVSSHAASYIHSPSPTGLTTHTRIFRFPIYAHHPRYGIGTQTFWFRVTLEYDGFNVRRASIVEDRGRSSTLVSSDFKITFSPAAYSAANEPVAAIVYNMSGRWDPIGRGDESFDGRFILDAQGAMRGLRVTSPAGWVRHGRVTHSGGGTVPRPTTARHSHTASFDRPGRTSLSTSEIRRLHAFYTGLPSAVRDEIGAGRIPIRVTGRASTTASVERNQAIARQRAQSVASALRDLAGSSARIDTASHGELGARTRDDTEAPGERRADIRIEYQLYR